MENSSTKCVSTIFRDLHIQMILLEMYLDSFEIQVQDSHIFCVGRIVPGEATDNLMENNISFENYDPMSKQVIKCNLELKDSQQIKCVDGQLTPAGEILLFPSQIVCVEGNYSKESNTFDCKNIYLGKSNLD